MPAKYVIRELSAIAVMMNAVLNEDGRYTFYLNEETTRRCIVPSAPKTQDDCPLYYQIMSVLHPNGFTAVDTVSDLADILIYVDFSRIFDRRATQKKYADRQTMAKDMFRPEGITLDFGRGGYRYVAFERSADMGRHSKLSFIREDFYEPVRRRIMLDMHIGKCQLSKLYAYNALMLSDGFRINDTSIWNAQRVVVVDNPVTVIPNVKVITVEDDGTQNAVRVYHRVEKYDDIEVTEFDGEGLISKEFADRIDYLFCGEHIHSSFQIRMPYIKGVVHEVDIKSLLAELNVSFITDIWGQQNAIRDVDLILTKSMFKGFGWMTENGLSWAEYLERCRKYDHALYISGVGKPNTTPFTDLNYQFLNTAAVKADEFRPADLPDGWDHSPADDPRHWITKTTEHEYYRHIADREYRLGYYAHILKNGGVGRDLLWAQILHKNPAFIDEDVLVKQFEDRADAILKDYAIGKLYAAGDNRYLSGDLMRFIKYLVRDTVNDSVLVDIERECLKSGEFYAPGATYYQTDRYTLLRNPHIARNEEAMVVPIPEVGYFRQKYLSHLHYVIMVDSETLIPERLGGADFDGDMIKTIADPLMNDCIFRNYGGRFDIFSPSLPVLKIPAAVPLMRDADDWEARFETLRSSFDSQIGQICNAAFDRSVVAYDENTDSDLQKRLREETETLEILTGLEIDSAKSGIKPDLAEYFQQKPVSRSLFLRYKNIVQTDDKQRAWYEETQKKKLEKFFASVDWSTVTSNVERLPYLARQLKANTPKLKTKPASDSVLFAFAKKKDWQKKLDEATMEWMKTVIADYNDAMRRIRFSRIERKTMTRHSDIERILYSRGQEQEYTPDELYGIFLGCGAERIAVFRRRMREKRWQLTDEKEREHLLLEIMPYDKQADYMDLLCDFSRNGYRILGDIICDLDDLYRIEDEKEKAIRRDTDSELIRSIMEGYTSGRGGDYREIAAGRTRAYIDKHINPDDALKYAVALKKRDFVYDVLLDRVAANARKR